MRTSFDFRSATEAEEKAEFTRNGGVPQVNESKEPPQVQIPEVVLQADNLRHFQVAAPFQVPGVFGKRPEPVPRKDHAALPVPFLNRRSMYFARERLPG